MSCTELCLISKLVLRWWSEDGIMNSGVNGEFSVESGIWVLIVACCFQFLNDPEKLHW